MVFILGKILAASVTGPVKMGMKLLETIRDEADKELHPDESQIKEKLIALQTLLESGQISEHGYDIQEGKLIARWREIQKSKEA